MLATFKFLDLNENPCPISGYLPLHAVVACGLYDMYDFLLLAGSDPKKETEAVQGSMSLGPLQLATRLGHRAMFEHIIQTESHTIWSWGHTTQTRLLLDGIDSGTQGIDVLDLVVWHDALPSTQQLLLDTCLDGFLYKLVWQKWRRFGRCIHFLHLMLQLAFLALLLTLGFNLKVAPTSMDRVVPPLVTLLTATALLFYELLTLVRWWRSGGYSFIQRKVNLAYRLYELLCWMSDVHMPRKISAYSVASLACILLLVQSNSSDEDHRQSDQPIWALLAVAAFAAGFFVIDSLVIQNQTLGVFALCIERVLVNDVVVFLVFLVLYLLNFYASLFIVYPMATDESVMRMSDGIDVKTEFNIVNGTRHIVPQFQTWSAALKAMTELAIGVDTFRLDLAGSADFGFWQVINTILFVFFYLSCIVLLVIVLLRLLMAMLTATFNQIRGKADLEWRLQFARYVLQAEVVWPSCFGSTHAGQLDTEGKRWHVFTWHSEHVVHQPSSASDAGGGAYHGSTAPRSSTLGGNGWPVSGEQSMWAAEMSAVDNDQRGTKLEGRDKPLLAA